MEDKERILVEAIKLSVGSLDTAGISAKEVLDEPMNGLDQNGILEIRNILLGLKQQEKLILLASHTREDIKILCDEVFYIHDKKVKMAKSV